MIEYEKQYKSLWFFVIINIYQFNINTPIEENYSIFTDETFHKVMNVSVI